MGKYDDQDWTPKGLCLIAQGWAEERGPTLGILSPRNYPKGVTFGALEFTRRNDATSLRLKMGGGLSQGSACRATLGYETQSRWDLKINRP